ARAPGAARAHVGVPSPAHRGVARARIPATGRLRARPGGPAGPSTPNGAPPPMIEAPPLPVARGGALPVLASTILPARLRHGFTTRAGGVSVPPFDSFNLGMRWGDARENVLENRRRLLEATGARALCFASQVHGARIVRVRGGEDPA